LKPVKIEDPKSTAFLVLDLVKQDLQYERRPRCVTSISSTQKFLTQARSKGLPIIHSYTTSSNPTDIFAGSRARPGEPLVRARLTNLLEPIWKSILKDKGIKTVIVVGTAAHGRGNLHGQPSRL
jgi:nicotinamidase-related amidase